MTNWNLVCLSNILVYEENFEKVHRIETLPGRGVGDGEGGGASVLIFPKAGLKAPKLWFKVPHSTRSGRNIKWTCLIFVQCFIFFFTTNCKFWNRINHFLQHFLWKFCIKITILHVYCYSLVFSINIFVI